MLNNPLLHSPTVPAVLWTWVHISEGWKHSFCLYVWVFWNPFEGWWGHFISNLRYWPLTLPEEYWCQNCPGDNTQNEGFLQRVLHDFNTTVLAVWLLDEAIIGLSCMCVCVCVHVFRREKIWTGKPCWPQRGNCYVIVYMVASAMCP